AVSARAPLCGGPSMLAGVWDADVRAATHAAFVGTNAAMGEEAFGRVAPILDAYAKLWSEVDSEACRAAARAEKEEGSLAGFRMACLDRQRTAMKALTTLFARADAQ